LVAHPALADPFMAKTLPHNVSFFNPVGQDAKLSTVLIDYEPDRGTADQNGNKTGSVYYLSSQIQKFPALRPPEEQSKPREKSFHLRT
jgi:hypothetical protein